jgi:hypothetical protein
MVEGKDELAEDAVTSLIAVARRNLVGLTKHGGRIAGGELWGRLGVSLLFCRARGLEWLEVMAVNCLRGGLIMVNEQ